MYHNNVTNLIHFHFAIDSFCSTAMNPSSLIFIWPCIADTVKLNNQLDATKYAVLLPQHVSGTNMPIIRRSYTAWSAVVYGRRKSGRELWCPVVSLVWSVFPWHCLSVTTAARRQSKNVWQLFCDRFLNRPLLTVSRSFMNVSNRVLWRMAIILTPNKVNLFVSSGLFVFWYHSPNILDTPHIWSSW
jgi:hypothetical protein